MGEARSRTQHVTLATPNVRVHLHADVCSYTFENLAGATIANARIQNLTVLVQYRLL